METDSEEKRTCCCTFNFSKKPNKYIFRGSNENASTEVLSENQPTDSVDAIEKITQNIGCFPGDNRKIIDFVIYFKETGNEFKKERKTFFRQLKNEDIDTYFIKVQSETPGTKKVFALLNCSIERLMAEAERLELEVPLVEQPELSKVSHAFKCGFWKRVKILCRAKEIENEPLVTAPFQTDIRTMFRGFNDDLSLCTGFSPSIRSLLVSNILNNLPFNVDASGLTTRDKFVKLVLGSGIFDNKFDSISISTMSESSTFNHFSPDEIKRTKNELKLQFEMSTGLPYILKQYHFVDAFTIHLDIFKNKKIYNNLINLLPKVLNRQDNEVVFRRPIGVDFKTNLNRDYLYRDWTQFRNVFKMQPLNKIRDYYGEYVAFYFAWCGTFISSLWFPSVVGLVFFIYGLVKSLKKNENWKMLIHPNFTTTESLTYYGDFYLRTFAQSFDNELTPYYAVVICLWGALFLEFWRKENDTLANKWHVKTFKDIEPNRFEYTKKIQEQIKDKDKTENLIVYYPKYKRYLKYMVSFIILVIMIILVALQVAVIVVFRIHMKVKVFSSNGVLQFVFGDLGSTVLNLITILIMDFVYECVAKKLTTWEIPRTKTEYNDTLVLKLFAFEFVNNYGSLFYIAFFRKIEYENGLFNLGKEYQDKCDEDNCMILLTIQVFVILLLKGFPRFIKTVLFPLFYMQYKKYKMIRKIKKLRDLNKFENMTQAELRVYMHLRLERLKAPFGSNNIREEYMEKVILYGYVMLFACSFYLGPLIVLMLNLIDLRIDATRITLMFRKPIAYKAQDIGIFEKIIKFLNICGIVSNGLIIAFTSNWSIETLKDNIQNRLLFLIGFEHALFVVWLTLVWIVPRSSDGQYFRMKEENRFVKELVLTNKSLANPKYITKFISRMSEIPSLARPSMAGKTSLSTIEDEELEDLTEDTYIPIQEVIDVEKPAKVKEKKEKKKAKRKKDSSSASPSPDIPLEV